MGEFVKAADTNEIAPGQVRLVVVKGKEIALFNVDRTYFALANACSHAPNRIFPWPVEPRRSFVDHDHLRAVFLSSQLKSRPSRKCMPIALK